MKLIFVVKILLSLLFLLSVSLTPRGCDGYENGYIILSNSLTIQRDSKSEYAKSPYIFTWGHVLFSPELENCPIKDRDYYEHVPSGQICKDPYGVPGWALEFHAMLIASIEVCQVVP